MSIPDRFLNVPQELGICQLPPTTEDLELANRIRSEFILPGHNLPYMLDVVRAFRLVKGSKTYLEIGTHDKGNLAYVSQLLDDEAIIIDVDIVESEEQKIKLQRSLKPSQTLISIVGDSTSEEVFSQVKRVLGDRRLDAIFIDGNHSAQYVIGDFSRYSSLISETAFVLFHDIYWQGDSETMGTAKAIECIDKLYPIYAVVCDNVPIHRFLPYQWVGDTWGCVGITSMKW